MPYLAVLSKVEKWSWIHIRNRINTKIWPLLDGHSLPSLVDIYQRICELSCRQTDRQTPHTRDHNTCFAYRRAGNRNIIAIMLKHRSHLKSHIGINKFKWSLPFDPKLFRNYIISVLLQQYWVLQKGIARVRCLTWELT